MEKWGEKSWLQVPLVFGGQSIGVLQLVEQREKHEFTDDQRELATTLAVPAAIAIHNARQYRHMADQNRHLESLVASSRAISTTVDLDEVLNRVAREACEALGTSQSAIYVHDPEQDALIYQILYDRTPTLGPDEPLGVVCSLADCPGDRAILGGDGIVIEYLSDPTVADDRRESMETWSERTVMSVPLRFRDERLGILRLYEFEEEREFTAQELQLAAGLGELAGAAVHNAQSFRREQAHGFELETLLEASKAMASSMVLDEVLQQLSARAAVALRASQCLIYEYDAERDTSTLRASFAQPGVDVSNDARCGTEFSLDDYPNDREVMARGVAVVDHIEDPHLAPDVRESMLEFGYGTCLTVPFIFRGETLGTMELIVMGDNARHFSTSEVELARGLGELAGSALHNAQTFRREQARTLELETLLEASKAMASTMELEEVLGQLAQRAAIALGTPQCLIYEHDAERDVVILRSTFSAAGVDTDGEDRVGTEYGLEEYPSDRETLRQGVAVEERLSDPDLAADVRASMELFGEKACLTVPLHFRGRSLGMMELIEHERERHFTEREVQLARALAEQAAIALNNARAYHREQVRSLELETLLEASKAMASSMDLEDVLGQLSQRAAVALGSPQCFIYEYDAERDVIALRATFSAEGIASDKDDPVGAEYDLKTYPIDRVRLQRGEIVEEHLSDEGLAADVRATMATWDEKACLTVPIVYRERWLGFMELIELTHERHFTTGETGFAKALADQAAAALNNARLYQRSQDYAARLESSYLETVTALAAAMEAKDHYTAEHADMLAMMAVSVGRKMGLSESELRDLQFASVLHDIGKIGIPGNILNKPDKLTDEEFAVMAEHTIIGERIISAIDYLAPIGKAIRAAHERWDGRGYPDGLVGETIPRPARILFVCDAFHAMTSDRPYRKAMPEDAALEELRRNAGAQFDPEVVEAFLEVWPRFEESEVAARTPSLN
jgi:HD-GYP domain-containing protein (c-di-GMP phosphodiesterase class II)